MFEALQARCRLKNGAFSGLADVYAEEFEYDDAMPSFFLGETLKYLYLLFSPADYYSLDDWVFTTEAHLIRAVPRCGDGSCTGPEMSPWVAPVDVLLAGACVVLFFVAARRRRPAKPRNHQA